MPMNPRLLRPTTSGFRPSKLTGLALWLDASDAATITLNGSSVSQWSDKSGNGRHAFQTANATHQPAYVSSGINSRGSISFDGVDDRLAIEEGIWAYTYPVNVFAVFKATAFTNAYNGLFGFYTNAIGSSRGYSVLIKSNGRSAIYATALTSQPNYDGTGAVSYSTATTHLFAGRIANNSILSWGDGTADGSSTGTWTLRQNEGTDSPSLITVGSDSRFSRFTNWQIGELLIYTGRALPESERQLVEGYLAWKWGSQSRLPAGHPYANARPR